MAKPNQRTYSRYSLDALKLLGGLIRSGRIEAKITTQELAERVVISRGLLSRIENGDPRVQIGAAFEAAALVGVQLFDRDISSLKKELYSTQEKLALLPKSIRQKKRKVDDDF